MDPSFLLGITSALQQQQMARSAASRLQAMEDEKQRQDNLLLWRRFTITRLIDKAEEYARDQNELPLQTAIYTGAHLNRMAHYGIIPDSFEDPAEQERLILLIRKLDNIHSHCLRQLNEEDRQTAERTIRAFDLTDLFENTLPMLEAYYAHFQYKSILASALKKNKRLKKLMVAAIVIPTTLLTLIAMVLSSIAHPAAGMFILCSIVGEIVLVMVVYVFIERKIDHSIPSLKAAIAQSFDEGQVGNDEFWNYITSIFGTFPTMEEMIQARDEQNSIVCDIFPPEEEEVCADEDGEVSGEG